MPAFAPKRFSLTRAARLRGLLVVMAWVAQVPLAFSQTAKTAARSASNTDQIIRFYQGKAAADPEDFFNYDRLSSAYVQKARETGDISYYELAEKGLKKSLDLESTHEEAAPGWIELANVHFAEHRFSDAAVEAGTALKLAPDAISAYAVEGDAYLESGAYERAAASYAHLADPAAQKLGATAEYLKSTRLAGLDWIQGRTSEAIDRLQQATRVAGDTHVHSENIAWTHFMLAEQYFQNGNLKSAEMETGESLKIYPGYHRALAERARVQTAQGRFNEAIENYKQALAIIPLPTYAAALGDLYLKTGNPAEAEKQFALVEYIGKIGALNRQVYNRELALFYADHDRNLARSVELARKELEVRHDVYTWDTLAWALVKSGDAKQAASAMQKALAQGTQDALLMYHAGYIQEKIGNLAQARNYLQTALKINPGFHVFYADHARRMIVSLDERLIRTESEVQHEIH